MLHLQPALPGDWLLWSTLDAHLPEAAFRRATREQLAYWITTGGHPIGILRYQFFWETIPFLTLLLLEAPYRGQGYGRAAMALWEAQLIQAGYGMALVSTQSDESAQHFYRKLGYRDCGCFWTPQGTSSQRSSFFPNPFPTDRYKAPLPLP